MNEQLPLDSDRLARYVSGEASLEERRAVEQWAASDPAHARELEALRALWSLTDGGATPEVDVDRAWDRLVQRLDKEKERGRVVPMRSSPVWKWAAAAVAVGIITTVFLLRSPASEELTAATRYVRSGLSDSSAVVLSPGSSLQARMGDERRVRLSGEAYFEVRRDPAHPFVVEAEGLTITVLGTGFTVTAYDTSSVVVVRVRHGRVRVQADTAQAELLAGDEVLSDRRAQRLVRQPVPSAVVWGDRILQFEQASLGEVARRLQTLFHVRIELRNAAIARCSLTASFDNEEVDDILRIIAETFGLRLEQASADRFILDGDGC